MTTKDEQLIFSCFGCKKKFKKDFIKELIKIFANIYEKRVYPDEYMDSWETFNDTSLIDKETFYNNVNMEDITNVHHRHAKIAFKNLSNKNLGDYHDLYIQSDILLLVDVFENLRISFIKVYELDPAHFSSPPGLAWPACLKKTGVKLELLTDVDMLLMVEKGIRGGIYHAIHRYVKSNNKHMKNYNKNKESSFLDYLDANNLYGWAMSEPLPVNGFGWMEDLSKIDEDFIKNYDKDSDKGYILEADVKYPKNLHDFHSDFPFLPERMKIDKCSKLICNLYNKKNYVVHIRSLKQALNHGLILKKVHRVIQFNQEAWPKPYIDMNTELRKQTKNDFEKDFFKLMNNLLLEKLLRM